ncbi:MAG: AraC family transcriptional regulator [Pseudomonadota bacterium]
MQTMISAPTMPSPQQGGIRHWGSVLMTLWQRSPATVLWWVLSFAITVSWLPKSFLGGSAMAEAAIIVAGSAACGWLWLLTRAVFSPRLALGPGAFAIVGLVLVVEASARLTHGLKPTGLQGEAARLVANAEPVACISMIAMAFMAIFHNIDRGVGAGERRFRLLYAAGLALMVFVGLIWVEHADVGAVEGAPDYALIFCGLGIIAATRLAIYFRQRNPLPKTLLQPRVSNKKALNTDHLSTDIRGRIERIMADEAFITSEGVKVADMAERLNVPAYKVTRCITGVLGYANFNQMMNARRIALAKARLNDANWQETSISALAFACGFASLGTFNRAFKAQTGQTPSDYRRDQKS